MRTEWLGMMIGLGLAGFFSACESDSDNDKGSSSRASSTTGTPQGGGGGDGGAGAAGGEGGSGGIGQAGAGGAGGCNSVPQPVGMIGECGGTAASNGSGGTFCSLTCDDQAANIYEVECSLTTGQCECKYNSQVYCTCTSINTGCSEHCCPPPWEGLGLGTGGGGQGGAMNTTSVATTSGQTGSAVATGP